MDWATFFKDYGQSLFTLGGVFLGCLITFLINYLNLRTQSKERDEDRQEQRRQAKLLAREKWLERDILKIMDSIEKVMKLVSGALNVDSTLQPTNEQLSLVNKEYHQTYGTIIGLVYSFDDDDIHSGFRNFISAMNAFFENLPELPEDGIDNRSTSNYWFDVEQSAGYFQWALRQKMISIQDS